VAFKRRNVSKQKNFNDLFRESIKTTPKDGGGPAGMYVSFGR